MRRILLADGRFTVCAVAADGATSIIDASPADA
jgi:hypothetical protein